MINLKEMTVEEALMAYGDGSDRFSGAGMISAGYVLSAEVIQLRRDLQLVQLTLARCEAIVDRTDGVTKQGLVAALKEALRDVE